MFTQTAVITITGIKPATLQNWMNRRVLTIPAEAPGRHSARSYEPVDVAHIAFVMELGKFGIPPKEADLFFDRDNAEAICAQIIGDSEKITSKYTKAVHVIRPRNGETPALVMLAIQRPDFEYLISAQCPRAFSFMEEQLEDKFRAHEGLTPLNRPAPKPFDFTEIEAQIVFCFDNFCERIALRMANALK